MVEIIKGNCDSTQQLKKLVTMVSKSNSTVLLRGETGCGKDVVARAIHESSGKKGELVNVIALLYHLSFWSLNYLGMRKVHLLALIRGKKVGLKLQIMEHFF